MSATIPTESDLQDFDFWGGPWHGQRHKMPGNSRDVVVPVTDYSMETFAGFQAALDYVGNPYSAQFPALDHRYQLLDGAFVLSSLIRKQELYRLKDVVLYFAKRPLKCERCGR